MHALYRKEREGMETLETAQGFAVYQYVGADAVYIQDIFVLPEFRRQGCTRAMAAQIIAQAKAQGKTRLLGTVCTGAKGVTISLKMLLIDGFEFTHAAGNMLHFAKAI